MERWSLQTMAVRGVALMLLFTVACSSPTATPTRTATAAASAAASTPTTSVSARVSATPAPSVPAGTRGAASYKDATYEVAGKLVRLTNGLSEVEAAPGSASKVVTRYFGNEATGDLNSDGLPDVCFVLTQSSGGSGTFYYAVVALQTADGWTGTNAVLLGDRIAPQTTELRGGALIVNYADRKPGEPMTASPSVGVSRYLHVAAGKLVE